ncbi:MAG: hypothetical protein HY903_06545 [Deltaproteobacteria bacterium]|nr:hypothetical protein [Deltaproteobacteria bacterium]
MVGETLEGALATLKRLDDKKVGELHKRFQEPRLYFSAGRRQPPQLKELRSDLIDETLWVWEIFPEGKDKATGYAGVVGYSGQPFVFVYFFDEKVEDLETARDAIIQIVHGFFTETEDDALWFYMPQPIDQKKHDMLVEGGFDPYEDETLPGVDLKKEAAYRIERHTYVAYYGNEAGENYESNDDDDPRELEF